MLYMYYNTYLGKRDDTNRMSGRRAKAVTASFD